VLIMNSRKMIYVHLQKCGGTAIERSLDAYCRWNDILIGSSPLGEMMQWQYYEKHGLHKHSSAIEIQQVIGKDVWSEYYSWCTVRNPFSRIVSLYGYAASMVFLHATEVGFPISASFEVQRQWAQSREYPRSEPWSFPAVKALLLTRSEPQPFSAFLRSAHLQADDAFAPQWWGVQSKDGSEMALNEFVRLEELGTRWPSLCERFGLLGVPLQRQYANATSRQFRVDLKTFFKAPEDVTLIRERFADDFEKFGYAPDQIS